MTKPFDPDELLRRAREVRVKVLPREEAFAIPDLIRTKVNLLPPGIEQIALPAVEPVRQRLAQFEIAIDHAVEHAQHQLPWGLG